MVTLVPMDRLPLNITNIEGTLRNMPEQSLEQLAPALLPELAPDAADDAPDPSRTKHKTRKPTQAINKTTGT